MLICFHVNDIAILLDRVASQVILGVPRPRAQSFLDGLLQGCFGLVVDTFVTPARQLILQTQARVEGA